MADPKHTHIQGDLNISAGLETAQGTGFVYITNSAGGLDVQGLTNLDQTSIDTTDGSFSITGSNNVDANVSGAIQLQAAATSYLQTSVGNMTVSTPTSGTLSLSGGTSTLNATQTTVSITGATGANITSTTNNVTIDANANLDVNAGGSAQIDAQSASHFIVTGSGSVTVQSTAGDAILLGGASDVDAIKIQATNAAGGIDIDAGSGGFDVLVTAGGFSIDGQNTASNITLATNAAAQDLTIGITGTSDSSLILSSTGTAADALKISATNATGGVDIDAGTTGIAADTTGPISLDSAAASNFTVTGAFDLTMASTAGSTIITGGEAAADAVKIQATDAAGGVDIDSGTAGITADTTGSISLDSAAASNFTTTTGTLTLAASNATDGRVVVQGTGAVTDAVRIYAPTAGGGIDMDSGSGGITIDSTSSISVDAQGASSNFTLTSTGTGQDLTIALAGAQDSSLVLSSTGTSSTDAIIISASAGGIDLDATGTVAIDTTDLSNGVQIATATAGVPVTIGTGSSTTTIAGDLVVSGTTTTINTQTLTVEDNIIVVNSANGEIGADGGFVIRRSQTPNAVPEGDVISDPSAGQVTGAFQAGSATPGTLVLSASASAVDDFYNGWWIQVTSGAGTDQVRRIKDYVGSTKTATIYVTADNTADFTDGLDLTTAPAATDTYTLFNSPYVASFYDESADKWVLAFTNLVPDPVASPGTSVVTIQRYVSFDSGPIVIHPSDATDPTTSTLNVNYINEQTLDQGVTIEGVLIKDGQVGGSTPDASEIVALPADASTAVDIVATATNGSFLVLVDRVQGATGTPSNTRQPGATYAVFAACSSGQGGGINRLVSTRGTTDNERIDCTYTTGNKLQLYYQNNRGDTGVTDYFRVKVIRVL